MTTADFRGAEARPEIAEGTDTPAGSVTREQSAATRIEDKLDRLDRAAAARSPDSHPTDVSDITTGSRPDAHRESPADQGASRNAANPAERSSTEAAELPRQPAAPPGGDTSRIATKLDLLDRARSVPSPDGGQAGVDVRPDRQDGPDRLDNRQTAGSPGNDTSRIDAEPDSRASLRREGSPSPGNDRETDQPAERDSPIDQDSPSTPDSPRDLESPDERESPEGSRSSSDTATNAQAPGDVLVPSDAAGDTGRPNVPDRRDANVDREEPGAPQPRDGERPGSVRESPKFTDTDLPAETTSGATDIGPADADTTDADTTETLPDTDRERWAIQEAPRTLADDDPLLTPTDQINTPERAEFRENLVRDVIGNAQPPEQGSPTLDLMGGGGASGKGFVLKALVADGRIDADKAVHLDPDGIKELIPEFRRMTEGGDSRAAAVVHEESSGLAKAVLSQAMNRGLNIIYDSTLGNPDKTAKLIDDAHAKGYEVRLFGVSSRIEII